MMSYLDRLIDQSGIAIGEPRAALAEGPALQPIELESFVETPPAPSIEPPDQSAIPIEPAPPAEPPASRPTAIEAPVETVIKAHEAREAPQFETALVGQAPTEQTIVVEIVTVPDRPREPRARVAEALMPEEARSAETLAGVRAWVAGTPAPDEVAPALQRVARLDQSGTTPESSTRRPSQSLTPPRVDRYEPTEDVHVTIGNIVVTVESPEVAPAASAPSPTRSAALDRRDIGSSTRLRRHYLRP